VIVECDGVTIGGESVEDRAAAWLLEYDGRGIAISMREISASSSSYRANADLATSSTQPPTTTTNHGEDDATSWWINLLDNSTSIIEYSRVLLIEFERISDTTSTSNLDQQQQ